MVHPTAVILVVGLTRSLIGPSPPHLAALCRKAAMRRLRPCLPAVTCSVQSSMLTGLSPREHGIVGNGWYNRELAEVQFWKQSGHLVHGEKVWETARKRDPAVTCAKLFWWYNMYGTVDYAVTPRPIYKADGRKVPDIHTHPPELRRTLQERLGTFPLFQFWGPGASIASSRWIADASMMVHRLHRPTLTLVYLPHLDYALQKLGPHDPAIPAAVAEIDAVVGDLLDYFHDQGVRVVVLSEYGIDAVDDAVPINRILRQAGLIQVREEQGLELLDPGASRAFAVADHQVAHIYVREADGIDGVAEVCQSIPEVAAVLRRPQQAAWGVDHSRAGELVLVSQRRRWFSYDYWLDERRAPDFARTVDIHRKPGYDPRELFLDPKLRFHKLRIAAKLLRSRAGMRTLFDVIPLDASLVRGSHGRVEDAPDSGPVLITARDHSDLTDPLPCERVRDVILDSLFSD